MKIKLEINNLSDGDYLFKKIRDLYLSRIDGKISIVVGGDVMPLRFSNAEERELCLSHRSAIYELGSIHYY